MTEKYYAPVYKELSQYFYELYWKDIYDLLGENDPRFNSTSALIAAIRSGRIYYAHGEFRGSYNIAISRELARFATYNGTTKTWIGFPPPDVRAAAVVANEQNRQTAMRMQDLIDDIPDRVAFAVDELTFDVRDTLDTVSDLSGKDLKNIGIDIDITPELSQRLMDNYTNNQRLNIKNWTDEQVVRLRDVVQRSAIEGYNREAMIDMIQSEFGVTMRKARFLARQETSLFVAEVRDERYQSAGVTHYRWSATGGAAGDGRTRELHRKLHGQIFSYDSPPIIDERTGERGNPGQAFGCRCVAIPVPKGTVI